MGSTEEPNESSNPHDSSSTPTQPLLSKPYPSPPIEQSHPDQDQAQYLQISYNYGPRQFKDLPFLLLFALFVIATFAFGIFASVNRNPNSSTVSAYSYSFSSNTCVKGSSAISDPSLYLQFVSFVSSSSHILRVLVWTLVITLVLSVPFALVILLFLKHYTKQLVYVSIPLFIIIPIFFNVYWFAACTVSPGCSEAFPLVYRIVLLLFVFSIIGVLVWIIVANWHRIDLTVRIIGVASDALLSNLGLFVVLPCLTLGLVAYFAPIVVFLVLARLNGKIVPHKSSGEYTCVWKQDSWVPAYYALAILTMLWSATTMLEAQVYVISGTISQWYFSKDDATPKGSIRSSLRNAFGPSFGTVCLSGLLICVVRVVRAVVESAREEVPGVVNLILRCCANVLLTSVDFLNKFTVNFAAIIGEAYCLSAKMTYELLKRNLLSAVFVETISTRLLGGIVFILSAIYAIVVFAILEAATDLGNGSYVVTAVAWALLIGALAAFVHVLDNVIETVYVCYAVDRDKGEVCKQDIHEVYVHLPISRNHRSSLDPRRTHNV